MRRHVAGVRPARERADCFFGGEAATLVSSFLRFVIALLSALAPLLGGVAVAARLPRKEGGLFPALGGFVVSASGVVALVVALGSVGLLKRDVLVATLVVVSAACLWVLRRRATRVGSHVGADPDANRPREMEDLSASSRAYAGRFQTAAVVFVGLVALWVVALVAFEGWRQPPLAYDALMYHLVFPAEWIRQGRLVYVPTFFAAPANSYFPCNGEAIFAYVMLGGGGERLVNLAQVPFLLAGAAALAGIARRCGLGWRASALAGFLFAAMPEVAAQAGSALVDVILASGVLLAVFFTLEYAATGSRAAIALAGASLGFVAGTKSLGLVFAALLALLVALAAWTSRTRGGRTIARDLGVLALCALPLGAFWYLRNWVITGNPFFPLEISLGSWTIFPGAHGRGEMLLSHFHMPPAGALLNAIGRLWGPPHDLAALVGVRFQVPVLLLVAIAASILGVRRMVSPGHQRRVIGAVLSLPVLMLVLFAVVNPYNTQYRFLLAGLALSLLPLAGASEIAGAGGVVFSLAGCAVVADLLVTWGQDDPRMEVFSFPWAAMLAVAAAGGAVAFALPGRRLPARLRVATKGIARHRGAVLVAGGSLVVSLLAACQPLVRVSYSDRAGASTDGQRARVWQFVRDLPGRRVIAYTGFNQPYPFYRPDLANSVRYVAVDGRQDFNLDDYLRIVGPASGLQFRRSYKPAYERQQPSREKWLRQIDALGVDTLVVSRLNAWDREEYSHDADGFPWEDGWARALPERFHLVLETPDMRVYAVVKGRA